MPNTYVCMKVYPLEICRILLPSRMVRLTEFKSNEKLLMTMSGLPVKFWGVHDILSDYR